MQNPSTSGTDRYMLGKPMKLPESTATIRSAGSRSSRAIVRVRGSIVMVGGQQVIESDRQGPGIDRAVGAVVGVRHVPPPNLARDPVLQVRRSIASLGASAGPVLQQVGHGAGGQPDITGYAELHPLVRTDGAGVVIDLDNRCARTNEIAVPQRPHVQ